ncbi:BglG family transcription antiterminator LicT [Paenibacillus sp. USHLN196]|uniref:BglG family transcription antiterminator LicT n=1 Tax=Paenibacillus sp. USHLN196 TaxID=3081291 RepID=UPI0030177AE4
MRVKKVFNNNVALVVGHNNKEIIVMGKAIGFQKYPGDLIDETVIEKTFVLETLSNNERLISLFNEIPSEDIDLAHELIEEGKKVLGTSLNENIIIGLSDHISFALKRAKEGLFISSPLEWEVRQAYPKEYAFGKYATSLIAEKTGTKLPDSEIALIAYHFVNAQMELGSSMDNDLMRSVLIKILDIVRYHFQIELDEDSLNYARFVTHLRYFIKRQTNGEKLTSSDHLLYDVVKNNYPKAFQCALKIKRFLSTSHEWECTNDELLYLTVHIQRVSNRTE